MLSSLINPILIALSLSTATGIFLHDTRLDKATTLGMATPTVMAPYQANTKLVSENDLHTHSERASFSQAVQDLKSPNPRIQPRNDEKKYLLQKHAARGHHAFDNYYLPIV